MDYLVAMPPEHENENGRSTSALIPTADGQGPSPPQALQVTSHGIVLRM